MAAPGIMIQRSRSGSTYYYVDFGTPSTLFRVIAKYFTPLSSLAVLSAAYVCFTFSGEARGMYSLDINRVNGIDVSYVSESIHPYHPHASPQSLVKTNENKNARRNRLSEK